VKHRTRATMTALWESADNLSPGYRVWWTVLPALMTAPGFLKFVREIPTTELSLEVLLD
jgi:hypothetical protein